MGLFTNFLLRRLTLVEVSEYFPVSAMNDLFRAEVDKILMSEDLPPDVRDGLEKLRSLNLVGYVDSAFRRSGVGEAERDEAVHDLLVRLLVSPGSLFRKWDRRSPLVARLKVAVRNAIRTYATKASRRRRRMGELPDDQPAVERPRSEDDLIHDFREWLRERHGEPAVAVFNARLEGRDVKDLIKTLGISAYGIKAIVRRIKSSVVIWAGTDPAFQEKVRRLMDAEQATLAKRFGRTVSAEA